MDWHFFESAAPHAYLATTPPDVDPLETAKAGAPVFVRRPDNATEMAPPEKQDGFVRCFVDGAWQQVADHRGETWYDANGNPVIVRALGDPAEAGLSADAPPPPSRWQVSRRTIVKRLAAAGALDAAEAALNAADSETRWRWNTVDTVGGVFSDDAATRALLAAIGADPQTILATE